MKTQRLTDNGHAPSREHASCDGCGSRLLFPPQYRTVGIASPASQPDESALKNGIAFLESCGYRVILAEHALDAGEDPYVCGTIQTRTDDFNALIRNPDVDLILCSRGGYGSMQILDGVDFDTLRTRNLPVLGYSDISAVHFAMLAENAGIPVVSPMAAKLPDALSDARTAASFHTDWNQPQTWTLPQITGGCPADTPIHARGFCSNLTLLAALCGTRYLPSFDGAILILEDIDEKIRVLDRYLTQLMLCGILHQVRAVVFGHLTGCGTLEEQRHLLRKFSVLSGKPFFCGLPFGHEAPQMVFRNGTEITLFPETLTI